MVPSSCAPEVAGGCDFVRKTLAAFTPETVSTTLMVDLHGYDSYPALAALEVCLSNVLGGRSTTQGSINLSTHSAIQGFQLRGILHFSSALNVIGNG